MGKEKLGMSCHNARSIDTSTFSTALNYAAFEIPNFHQQEIEVGLGTAEKGHDDDIDGIVIGLGQFQLLPTVKNL